jgi:CarD family transcriptional regulator
MNMYENGDYVICRSGGVWRVAGTDGDTVRLVSHGSGAITLETGGDDEIVRKIASKETILEVIERIPFIRSLQAPNHKARLRLYDQSMAKYDEIEWIKVIKTIYLRQKIMMSLKSPELEYSEKAKDYFHAEVSILLEMPVGDVEDYISDAVSKN